MKFSLTAYLAIALALSVIGNCVQLYRAGGAKPRCEAAQAKSVVKADRGVRADENARDKKLDAVSRDSKADTAQAVGKVESKTHERAAAIDAVPVSGNCRAPVGLPPLDAAVDQANRAAGL